jgi:hypothetical protein
VTVVTALTRRVLYDGPPANAPVGGRRQANARTITVTLPNGASSVATAVLGGSGSLISTSTADVFVEGVHAGQFASRLPLINPVTSFERRLPLVSFLKDVCH